MQPFTKAIIYKGELDYLSRFVLDSPDIETGGDLFGFWTNSGIPVIQYIIGPGNHARHQRAFFNQDIEYLKKSGDILRNAHGLQHIGEWHSHHTLGLSYPSGHDCETIVNAIRNYRLSKFLLVIATIKSISSLVNGYLFSDTLGDRYSSCAWVLLNGSSPLRNSIHSNKANNSFFSSPKTKKPRLGKIEICTLESKLNTKPEFQQEYWLNDKANHLLLFKIAEYFKEIFKEVEIRQTKDTVYILFEFDAKNYFFVFPPNFPSQPPYISDNLEVADMISPMDWDSASVIESINKFISQFKSQK